MDSKYEAQLFRDINVLAMERLGLSILKFNNIISELPLNSQFYNELKEQMETPYKRTIEQLVETLIFELKLFGLIEGDL